MINWRMVGFVLLFVVLPVLYFFVAKPINQERQANFNALRQAACLKAVNSPNYTTRECGLSLCFYCVDSDGKLVAVYDPAFER